MLGKYSRKVVHLMGFHVWSAWQSEAANACVKARTCLVCGIDDRAIMHEFVGEEVSELKGNHRKGVAIIYGYCARCKRRVQTGYDLWRYVE
jgi:hypothetical protein